ncbi:MAG: hypothetical protein IJJ01_02140 [Firmicutes bacterium]|nr:hypothetical protein [Bacillota bacterium]
MSVIKIKLSVLADAFEEAFDGWEQYLNKDTGTITAVPGDAWTCDDTDTWEEILSMIEESEQFVRLPNQYEINEYRIMEEFADFAGSGLKYVSDEQAREIGQKLFEALQGRGAFRRFKSALSYYGIADEYFAYRHIYYVELAKEWCQDHEIGFVRE